MFSEHDLIPKQGWIIITEPAECTYWTHTDTHRLKLTLPLAICGFWCEFELFIDDGQTLTLLYAAVSATTLLLRLLLLPHAAAT